MENTKQEQKRPSLLWVLLPIFLGVIGGIIGYFILRNKHRKFAKEIFLIGLIITIIYTSFSLITRYYVGHWMSSFKEQSISEVERKVEESIKGLYSEKDVTGPSFSDIRIDGKTVYINPSTGVATRIYTNNSYVTVTGKVIDDVKMSDNPELIVRVWNKLSVEVMPETTGIFQTRISMSKESPSVATFNFETPLNEGWNTIEIATEDAAHNSAAMIIEVKLVI